MKSLGWALVQLDWYSLIKGHLNSYRNTRGALQQNTYIHTEEMPMKTQWEVGYLKAKERALQRNKPYGTNILSKFTKYSMSAISQHRFQVVILTIRTFLIIGANLLCYCNSQIL